MLWRGCGKEMKRYVLERRRGISSKERCGWSFCTQRVGEHVAGFTEVIWYKKMSVEGAQSKDINLGKCMKGENVQNFEVSCTFIILRM